MNQPINRYDGKPFLRLLDSYVLDAIGQLSDSQREGLALLAPKLNAIYNSSCSWQEIVRIQMDLPRSFPESIRKMWVGYLGAAKNQGLSIHPHEFVERFVDENFPEALSQ
jgi:hypothetical protein